jgi:hypothetical protein
MPAFLTDLLNIFASLCKIRLYPQSLRIQAVLFYVDSLPNVASLFTQGHKKSSYEIRNCLTFFVDQPGLEPGTSRL